MGRLLGDLYREGLYSDCLDSCPSLNVYIYIWGAIVFEVLRGGCGGGGLKHMYLYVYTILVLNTLDYNRQTYL